MTEHAKQDIVFPGPRDYFTLLQLVHDRSEDRATVYMGIIDKKKWKAPTHGKKRKKTKMI